MKNRKVRSLLAGTATVVFSFVTAGTLTACSLSFQGHGTSTSADITSEFAETFGETISVQIDSTDLGDEEAVRDLTQTIVSSAGDMSAQSGSPGDFTKASLVRVVDGDTIAVEIDGTEYKVRLIGVNTPESVAPGKYLEETGKENSAAGAAASDFTKDLLEDYDTVYLMKDVSDTDRYDRLLRYVWLEIPENACDITEISTKMLNGILLEQGYAEVAIYEPDTGYEDYFIEIAD